MASLHIILARAQPSDEEHRVYLGPEDGPFRCDRCRHYHDTRCDEEHIIDAAHAGEPGLGYDRQRGLAIVQPAGCSDYFAPKKGGT